MLECNCFKENVVQKVMVVPCKFQLKPFRGFEKASLLVQRNSG